ncbi:MAG: FKBP-type peptidyl-prolyl cis-trans isomerase [Bacteroidaceae bacterium]|jgi:FKBP-type peptidyl-prolyl cis-trans isomerase FklB|nr:FKBP-type peptidyl-prolyl cis-trans isomerase [Bacteroidaceae bacterium]
MKKLLLLLPLLLLASCKNSEENYDSHHDWKERNAQWFAEVYDAAQAEIAAAKAQHGNSWEEHCNWRIYKTLLKSQDVQGASTDYIVCKINQRGVGDFSPAYTDSVRLYYRAWIMDENYPVSKTNMTVFSQSYYGDFDRTTAAPIAMPVTSTVEGFMTAIQYMVKGDEWDVYIPQQLAYKETESEAVPAYSTLLYRIRIELVHKSGEGMSEWR